MVDMDSKGLNQLLLSPVFLLNQILAVVMPGALLLLLLSLKGNETLRQVWLDSPFGYKTKIAIFLLLSYFIGSTFRSATLCLFSLHKGETPEVGEMNDLLKGQSPEFKKMFLNIIHTGVVLSAPGLADRLSIIQSEGGFCIGTGTALLIAATVRGDGSLRWLEALLAIVMLWAGVLKGKTLKNETSTMFGVGLAHLLGRMTPQQLQIAAALIQSLNGSKAGAQTIIANPPIVSENEA